MILKKVLVIAGAVGLCGPAFAETWSAKPTLLPEQSKPSCQSFDTGIYELTYEGSTLSGATSTGAKFATSAAANGSVRVSLGGWERSSQLELSGNAKTRDLAIYNPKVGCRWKLSPIQ